MNTDLPKIDRIEHWSDSDKADRTPEQRIYKAVLSRSQGADVDARELREQALKVIKQYNFNGERPAAITQGRRGRKRKAA